MGGDDQLPTKKNNATTAEGGRNTNATPMKNWFMSLSRRPRSNNAQNFDELNCSGSENDVRKCDQKSRKDESSSVFQRIKRKMEKKFSPRRRKIPNTDAVGEDTPEINYEKDSNTVQQSQAIDNSIVLKWDRYLKKKWVEGDSGPNLVMYTACMQMLNYSWYWGEISRHDAQRQLTGRPNGSFLVRDSESNGPQFTLSFRIRNSTLHYRLQYHDNCWHFESKQYESIVDMIEDVMLRSTDEKFICYVKGPCEMQPPFPVTLKYPISRYSKVDRLQDMCRRVIRTYMEPEDVLKLPIPVKLQEYLNEDIFLFF